MKMGELNKPQYKDSRGKYVDHALEDLKKVSGKEGRLKKVQAAIAALQSIKPIK
jgi:hypothetical protein